MRRHNLFCSPQLLFAVLFLGFLAFIPKPASATDPLGSVTANPISCGIVKGGHGMKGGVCFKAIVSCPNISQIPVALKVNRPVASSLGTILFSVGGGGIDWYDRHFTFGAEAIQEVVDAGYTAVQFDWEFPPLGRGNAKPTGWLTGPGGPRALACRWATLAQWVHDRLHDPSTAFCATGNSAGSAAAGYAVGHYGMGPEFDMLEETGGPPFARVDNGCLCNVSAPTPCGQGTLSECFLSNANAYLDPAYDNRACSNAEKTHHSPDTKLFLRDSLNSPDATFDFPSTDIHFVFGGMDSGPSVPEGMEWVNAITAKHPPVVDCVADAPHEIPNVKDGAQKIASDLIAFCKQSN